MKHALIVILALAFASPAAADPPRAATVSADVIAPLVVNGNGTVNDGGRRATWWFEYVAPWSPQPMTTQVQDIPPSADDQPVTAQLGTIASGTTYRYRLVLQLSDGYVYGDWVEFTTPEGIPKAAPPIPRITFSSRQLHVARDKTMSVLMGCRPGTAPCTGTIAVRSSSDSITRRERFTIGAGHWKRIRLALTRNGRRLGRRDDGMQLSIEVRTAGALLSASRQFSAK